MLVEAKVNDPTNAPWAVTVKVREKEGTPPNTKAITPGYFTGPGTFVDADLSAEPKEVQAACAEAWTDEVVRKWKELVPWKEPVPPPPLENISKNIIWERMTDPEATAADNILKAQSPKIRRIYDGATYISVRANEYPMLLGAMTQLFGAQRAAEILKPNF